MPFPVQDRLSEAETRHPQEWRNPTVTQKSSFDSRTRTGDRPGVWGGTVSSFARRSSLTHTGTSEPVPWYGLGGSTAGTGNMSDKTFQESRHTNEESDFRVRVPGVPVPQGKGCGARTSPSPRGRWREGRKPRCLTPEDTCLAGRNHNGNQLVHSSRLCTVSGRGHLPTPAGIQPTSPGPHVSCVGPRPRASKITAP